MNGGDRRPQSRHGNDEHFEVFGGYGFLILSPDWIPDVIFHQLTPSAGVSWELGVLQPPDLESEPILGGN